MDSTQTVASLNIALDVLLRKRKALNFLVRCSANSYQQDARQELAKADIRIEAVRHRLLAST